MKLLLDANVMISVLVASEKEHITAVMATNMALEKYEVLLTPATFVICHYFIKKYIKQAEKRERVIMDLIHFQYTTENDTIIRQALQSDFEDKEDALQYYSALNAGAEMIITFNIRDYQPYARLPVLHPTEFILLEGQ
ncbi:MAG: hypothetical protein KatS3mg031_0181 [Chitinophagales bacterium]|nr:MAG: hypothetical protein KatS3mg031_0181 [Chitinophagales bacterium]